MTHHLENIGIVASTGGAFVVSQVDTTGLGQYAWLGQLTAFGMCMLLLGWLVMRRIPQIEKEHRETIYAIIDRDRQRCADILAGQKECNSELCEKIEENTEAVQDAARQHLNTLQTYLLKIEVNDKTLPPVK